MKKFYILIISFYLIGFSGYIEAGNKSAVKIKYQINLLNHKDDLFHVTCDVNKLSSKNNIYNFAVTAPGAYEIMDYGRFVKSFKALDKNGAEIATEKISTNRWKISKPELVVQIKYDIEDSYDADIKENLIAPMSGTGIEDNFIVLNNFGVIGYFEGLQANPVKIKLAYVSNWTVGTSLRVDNDGYYSAESFDHLADSPFLLGELTTSSIKVNGIDVEMYVYAPDTSVTASKILKTAEKVLKSSGEFIGYAPAKNYAFLMCLMDRATFQKNKFRGAGVLEHCTSSLYTIPSSPRIITEVQGTMAHEFLHILTPLNLHSEIIHNYNFVTPTASEHIWLYEGVTEWASNIMQLRGGLLTPKEFMNDISAKMNTNDRFDPDYSLSNMSLEVYTQKGSQSFVNFYNKGALTATILDLKLLELSGGKKGLREVFLSLLKKYGKNKPFSEKEFFNLLVKETYPEIDSFINEYIRGTKPLPIKEYFGKMGFGYTAEKISSDKRPTFGISIRLNENNELILLNITDEAKSFGVKEGDILVKALDTEVTPQTAQPILMKAMQMQVGAPYQMVVKRGDKIITCDCKLLQRKIRHSFDELADLTPEQKSFRECWSKNLK